jgi:hypothetical protein
MLPQFHRKHNYRYQHVELSQTSRNGAIDISMYLEVIVQISYKQNNLKAIFHCFKNKRRVFDKIGHSGKTLLRDQTFQIVLYSKTSNILQRQTELQCHDNWRCRCVSLFKIKVLRKKVSTEPGIHTSIFTY